MTHETFARAAATAVELDRNRDPGWLHAVVEARNVGDDLARAVARGDDRAIDSALSFLSAGRRFHGSGYISERLMRRLSRAPLTPAQQADARRVVVAHVRSPQTRGSRYVGALAGAFWDQELADDLAAVGREGEAEGRLATAVTEAARSWRRSNDLEEWAPWGSNPRPAD